MAGRRGVGYRGRRRAGHRDRGTDQGTADPVASLGSPRGSSDHSRRCRGSDRAGCRNSDSRLSREIRETSIDTGPRSAAPGHRAANRSRATAEWSGRTSGSKCSGSNCSGSDGARSGDSLADDPGTGDSGAYAAIRTDHPCTFEPGDSRTRGSNPGYSRTDDPGSDRSADSAGPGDGSRPGPASAVEGNRGGPGSTPGDRRADPETGGSDSQADADRPGPTSG